MWQQKTALQEQREMLWMLSVRTILRQMRSLPADLPDAPCHQAYALEKGIPCWISMEERMACGVGACLACVCKSKDVDSHSHVHNKRVCKDGPVFLSTEVEL